MMKHIILFLAFYPLAAQAAQTAHHELNSFADLAKGELVSTALRSDGSVIIGADFVKLAGKAGSKLGAKVLALQADQQGGAYVATADPAQVFHVDKAGRETLLYTASAAMISALYFDPGQKKLYLASGPKGGLYRLDLKSKKLTVLCQSQAQYIWAIKAHAGKIYAATGLPGGVIRLAEGAQCSTLFSLPETHARSLLIDKSGRFVVGGGEKGILYRWQKKTGLRALYDSDLQEITSITSDKKGRIFASALSSHKPDKMAAKELRDVADDDGRDASKARVIKSSQVFMVDVDGDSQALWASKKDGAYALAVFADKLWIATGGRGRLYSVDLDRHFARSLQGYLKASELTALDVAAASLFIAGSANGALWRVGTKRATKGLYLSAVLDAKRPAIYGALQPLLDSPAGSRVVFSLRQGQTKKVDKTWGKFVGLRAGQSFGLKQRSRYVQLRAELHAAAGGASPKILALDLPYRCGNRRPKLSPPQLLAPNIRLQPVPASLPKGRSFSISDDSFADFIPVQGVPKALRPGKAQVKQSFAKAWRSVTWKFSDADKDRLRSDVNLLGIDGTQIAQLARGIEQNYCSFESSRWPDGLYRLQVIVSDRLDNSLEQAREQRASSAVFRIDNTPPRLISMQARRVENAIQLSFSAQDASPLRQAWCSVDGQDWQDIASLDGLVDSSEERFKYRLAIAADSQKDHFLRCLVEDAAGNQGQAGLLVK